MSNKLQKVIDSLDDCEGEMIPYPTVKKMLQIREEIIVLIKKNADFHVVCEE